MAKQSKQINPNEIDKYDQEHYVLNSYRKKKGKHKRAKAIIKNRSI